MLGFAVKSQSKKIFKYRVILTFQLIISVEFMKRLRIGQVINRGRFRCRDCADTYCVQIIKWIPKNERLLIFVYLICLGISQVQRVRVSIWIQLRTSISIRVSLISRFRARLWYSQYRVGFLVRPNLGVRFRLILQLLYRFDDIYT